MLTSKRSFTISLLAFVACNTLRLSHGHGHCIKPAPYYTDQKNRNRFSGQIQDPNKLFPGVEFDATSSDLDYATFIKQFKPSEFLEMIRNHVTFNADADDKNGYTDISKAIIEFPKTITWGIYENTSKSQGFRDTHVGIVLVYCDEIQIFYAEDCVKLNNKGNKGPATFKLENKNLCEKAKALRVYWLTTQPATRGGFQLYIAAFGLKSGSGESTEPNSSTSPPSDPSPSPTPSSPSISDAPPKGKKKGHKKCRKSQ